MREYRFLKVFIIIFLVVYFFAGLSTEVFLPGKQKNIPPLFSWFLFQWVPDKNDRTKYDVRITQVGDRRLNPPVLFSWAYGIVDDPSNPKARELIGLLGQSLVTNRMNESRRLTRILEQVYLPPGAKYEVVTVKYDPITFYKTEKYDLVGDKLYSN